MVLIKKGTKSEAGKKLIFFIIFIVIVYPRVYVNNWLKLWEMLAFETSAVFIVPDEALFYVFLWTKLQWLLIHL